MKIGILLIPLLKLAFLDIFKMIKFSSFFFFELGPQYKRRHVVGPRAIHLDARHTAINHFKVQTNKTTKLFAQLSEGVKTRAATITEKIFTQ